MSRLPATPTCKGLVQKHWEHWQLPGKQEVTCVHTFLPSGSFLLIAALLGAAATKLEDWRLPLSTTCSSLITICPAAMASGLLTVAAVGLGVQLPNLNTL